MPLTFRKMNCVVDTEYHTNMSLPKDNTVKFSRNELLQISWCLYDGRNHQDVVYRNYYIKRDDLPRNFYHRVTGLTKQFLDDHGVPIHQAIEAFMADIRRCQVLIGFNLNCETNIVGVELLRLLLQDSSKKSQYQSDAQFLQHRIEHRCLKQEWNDRLQLRNENGRRVVPSLPYVYKHCFPNYDHFDTHSSQHDVMDTFSILLKMNGVIDDDNTCPHICDSDSRRCGVVAQEGENRYCEAHRPQEACQETTFSYPCSRFLPQIES